MAFLANDRLTGVGFSKIFRKPLTLKKRRSWIKRHDPIKLAKKEQNCSRLGVELKYRTGFAASDGIPRKIT